MNKQEPAVYDPDQTKAQLMVDKLHDFFQNVYNSDGVLVSNVTVEWATGEGGLVVKNVNIEGWQK